MSGLVKTFGRTRALDGLELTVGTGEVHGFLGPNGAGKSTTIRILLGLMRADSGTAELLGGDPWRDAADLHRRLAYVPGDVTLWPNLSGGEVIDLLGRLRGGVDPQRREELIERFELDPRKKGRAYSKGNRQKVALVAALASDVELLILDEPTSGLDPLMEAVFQGRVARGEGAGPHRAAVQPHPVRGRGPVRPGEHHPRRHVVETGTLAELRHLTRTSVTAELAGEPVGLADLSGVHDLRVEGNRVSCQVEPAHLGELFCASLTARGCATSPPPRPRWKTSSCATTARRRRTSTRAEALAGKARGAA